MLSLRRLICVATLSSCAIATCFFPNGNESPADTPCNPDAQVSHCCYKNQACLSNGLCVSDPHNPIKARLHRGTCSDKTWNSKDCPNHCTSVADLGAPVFSCNQTNVDSYCCFGGCECNASFETFRFPEDDVYTLTIINEAYTNTHVSTSSSAPTSSSSSSPSTSTSTESKSTTAAPTSTGPAQTESPSSQNDTQSGEKDGTSSSSNSLAIGAGVGIGVGGAILIAIVVAFLFWRRSKKHSKNETNPYTDFGNENYSSPRDQKPLEADDGAAVFQAPAPGATSYDQKGATSYAHYNGASASSPNPFDAPQEMPVGLAPVELPASPKNVPDFKRRL